MAPLPSSPPLLFLLLLLITPSLFLQPSSSSSLRSPDPQPSQLGFRVTMTHVDSNRNLTRLQLIQRSILRGKCRLDRLNEIPNTAPAKGVRAPVYVGDGEFLMNVSIGTPPVPFSGIIDTGSDLIWTQCLPCTKCFKQPTPIFDPSKSSTCANVSCTSDLCKDMNVFECSNGCKYLYTYGDESSTEGFMATDTITFMDLENNPVSIPNIGFGCGVNNQGSGLGQGAGIVGLGRGPVSLVSQLGLGKFSYCLTSLGEKKPSNVLFGSLAVLNYTTSGSTHRRATPLIQNSFQPSFYYVAIEGITIGETLLPISRSVFKLKEDGSGGMIIDSGTTLTYLQEDAFRVVKREFTSQMKLRVSDRTDTTGLDLCFDLPTKHVSEISIPRLKLHFEGVDLELPAENYMISDPSTGLVCLAMAASSGISIFGNIQQQNLLVLHDLEEETVSFLPIQCDQL